MDFPQLTSNILVTHNVLQSNAMRAINQNITARNWLVGYWIVEYEQQGEDRAKYGDNLLLSLANAIQIKGLGKSMLNLCRSFYKVYPGVGLEVVKYLLINHDQQIIQSLIGKSQIVENENDRIFQSLIGKFQVVENKSDGIFQSLIEKSDDKYLELTPIEKIEEIPQVSDDKIFKNLSFTHIIPLLSIDDPLKRSFYEIETIKGCWSVRELRRQIDTLCYERAGISKNPEKLMALVNEKAETSMPSTIVKSPYVFDFLGLKSADVVEESDLETLLISHIQEFILELGEGFCFEGRQKRILIDDEYFFVDLIFYHRILKCHVLVELKTRKFNYADMAQLNMYVAYYRDKIMTEGDNAPIGILLCTDATTEMVKFATAGMDENLFVSKYLLQLPSKEKFVEFLNNELKQL
jgi:predicted nuclease of restriction endonuclease-like (RecB) superfamily